MTDDTEWEYGFYDSEDGPSFIYWYVFGLLIKTAEMAEHTGSKSTYGEPVIVRRRKGSTDWEHVTETTATTKGMK